MATIYQHTTEWVLRNFQFTVSEINKKHSKKILKRVLCKIDVSKKRTLIKIELNETNGLEEGELTSLL